MIIGISGKIGAGKDEIGGMIQYLTSGHRIVDNMSYDDWKDHEYRAATETWIVKKFAGKLKQIGALILGCEAIDFEDREFKNKDLGKEWEAFEVISNHATYMNYAKPRIFVTREEANEYINHIGADADLQFTGDNVWSNFGTQSICLTPRKVLQLLGTEAGRGIIHPQIWVNALFADYVAETHTGYAVPDQHLAGKYRIPGKSEYPVESHNKVIGTDRFEWMEHPKWIITDVRFPNEADEVIKKEGILIRVERGDKFDQSLSATLTHASETSLDDYEHFNYVLDNNGTIAELLEKVRAILKKENVI